MFAGQKKLLLVVFVFVGMMILDASHVEAQGFLQRLGSRIRSRIVTPYTPPSPFAPGSQPDGLNPGAPVDDASGNAGSRYNPYPSADDPQSPSATSSPRNGAGEPTPLEPNAKLMSPRETHDGFGQSILAPFGDGSRGETGQERSTQTRGTDEEPTAGTERPRATLGVRVMDPRPGAPMVRVVSFHDGSQADDAGLLRGDAILAINGVPTPNISAIAAQLSKYRPGDVVDVQVGRRDLVMSLSIPLVPTDSSRDSRGRAETPATAASAKQPVIEPDVGPTSFRERPPMGIDVDEPEGSRGAVVVEVRPGSPAANAGIRVGDRIVAVDHRFVVDPQRLAESIDRRRSPLAPMPIKLVRDELLVDLVVYFDGRGASATAEDSTDDDSSDGASGLGGSVLQGIGSKLGSWLGGSSGKASATGDGGKSDGVDLPEPLPLPEDPANLTTSQGGNVGEKDVLEFGDGEPIDDAIFQDARDLTVGELPPAMQLADELNRSAATETLSKTIAPDQSSGSPSDDTLRQLRAEIERLQARLESLEKAK